jgi:hypothetical protein
MEKNPTQKSFKIKSFFSGNPIIVFVSPYNYFSITPIAMIIFSHEALFTRIIHSKFFLNQNKSQLVMTWPVLAATHFGPLGPLGVKTKGVCIVLFKHIPIWLWDPTLHKKR